jgi:N-acetylglucosaminyldiphosphoundecaprenol N-acetyl-beta-D-mannosaminyltransferase
MAAASTLQLEARPMSGAEMKRIPRASILGCEIDMITLPDAVSFCVHAIESNSFAQHMSINAAKLVAIGKDPELATAVRQSELVTADGQAVVWASRLLGGSLPERVAGIDLMHALLKRASLCGYRVYILGATEQVLKLAVDRLRKSHPTLNIVGTQHGYYDDAQEDEIAYAIRRATPDILLVAMSSPRKEMFLARHRETVGVPFVMGVGGAIDVVAGLRRRAPRLLQRVGLEWLFRLVQEPRRLGKRYFVTNIVFLRIVLSHALRRVPGGRAQARRRAL